MFDYKHYVPVLRWKQAEQFALRDLHDEYHLHITPLIELIPHNFIYNGKRNPPPSVDDLINKTADTIANYWGDQPAFLDLQHLLTQKNYADIFIKLNQLTHNLNLSLIPVTGLSRPTNYNQIITAIIKKEQKGVCIRLRITETQISTLHNELQQLLSLLEVTPNQTDLIIDYGIITQSYINFTTLCRVIPNIQNWRTFTVISGAFPENLMGMRPQRNDVQRIDWMIWRNEIDTNKLLPRRPTYGDYTIQYPIYIEPPERANVSASIRYTADTYWIIMRGEGLFHEGSPGHSQYPANAELLCGLPEFCQQNFSSGDNYIYNMRRSSNPTGTGNPPTWLRAGINHHMTFVVHQLANLS